MDNKQYKLNSIKEFTKAASKYEGDEAGLYKMCRKDYPSILEEVSKEPFNDLLDAGCGTSPMISLLSKKYPDKHYTGLDLTPAMIEQAKAKNLPNATFVVGDCENFPFGDDSFDVIICSNSLHHYPNPVAFFESAKRCLRKNGRLVIRDWSTKNKFLRFYMDKIEIPVLNFFGKGDVKIVTIEAVVDCCKKVGLKVEKAEIQKGSRLHCLIRKI